MALGKEVMTYLTLQKLKINVSELTILTLKCKVRLLPNFFLYNPGTQLDIVKAFLSLKCDILLPRAYYYCVKAGVINLVNA